MSKLLLTYLFNFLNARQLALRHIHSLTHFNTKLRSRVAWIRSSLLVKIQWQKHHYISEHRCGSVWDL